MNKALRVIKTLSFILAVVEIALITTFAVFYFGDFFNTKAVVDTFYIVIGALAVSVFDILYLWIITGIVSALRQKSDLKAAEVIGNDVQEAYNFAMIGLAVTDDNSVVLWTNDLFRDRHIDIIDMNILEWQPSLLTLKENNRSGEAKTKITIGTRTYEVKFLPEAGLWIFKDTTDFEEIYRVNHEQSMVVGILSIDNYNDVVGDDDFNDTVAKVKNLIFEYTRKNGVLIRRMKDDTYSLLCNFKAFEKIKSDNFSIIDTVRAAGNEDGLPLTLSIGLACNFDDVIKLNELAKNALDIAMSRGGDQVAVSVYGNDMQFYGGKSEAQEKRNRVKVRVLADSAIELIKGASNVLIMGHTEADMDAFGSCLGIKAICDHFHKEARIIMDLKKTEQKTRSAITSTFSRDELNRLFVSPKDYDSFVKSDTILVVCDVHIPKMTMCPQALEKVAKVMVIDHHRRSEEYIESPVFNHIDPASSSASEIVIEFIRYATVNPKIELSPTYATFMLSGIFLDSSYFKSKNTGLRTFEACTILKEYGADNSIAYEYLKDEYAEYSLISEIVSKLEYPKNDTAVVAVAVADPERIFDRGTLAKAANMCMSFKGIRASFVIGRIGAHETFVSARSDGTINTSILSERLGGGGHFSMSAALIQKSDVQEVKDMVFDVIEKHIREASYDAGGKKAEEEDD